MKNHLEKYKQKLESGICDYMQMPISERSATAIHAMFKALRDVERRAEPEIMPFTYDDAQKWAQYMVDSDGKKTGAHWTIEQTTAVAEANGVYFDHIYDWDWWITINMMYSDYCKVAEKFGVDTPEFFAELAKAFLFDKDGPEPIAKLSAYYHGIVCPDMHQ